MHKGETVAAGTTLAVLADYSELYIQGNAFEQDVELLSQSGQRNWKITALFEGAGDAVRKVEILTSSIRQVTSMLSLDLCPSLFGFQMKSPEKCHHQMVSDFWTGSIVRGSEFSCEFLLKNGPTRSSCL